MMQLSLKEDTWFVGLTPRFTSPQSLWDFGKQLKNHQAVGHWFPKVWSSAENHRQSSYRGV